MSPQARMHQGRALAEARVLESMANVPRELRKAQAARVFDQLRAMIGAGSDDREKRQARRWWLDPE